jgi:hypothetical protein
LDGFTGVGGAEGIGIGRGWFVGGGEVFRTACVEKLPFIVRAGVIQVFKGPMARVDAALEERLD